MDTTLLTVALVPLALAASIHSLSKRNAQKVAWKAALDHQTELLGQQVHGQQMNFRLHQVSKLSGTQSLYRFTGRWQDQTVLAEVVLNQYTVQSVNFLPS